MVPSSCPCPSNSRSIGPWSDEPCRQPPFCIEIVPPFMLLAVFSGVVESCLCRAWNVGSCGWMTSYCVPPICFRLDRPFAFEPFVSHVVSRAFQSLPSKQSRPDPLVIMPAKKYVSACAEVFGETYAPVRRILAGRSIGMTCITPFDAAYF